MIFLSIDFETRSAVDLKATGVYRYAEDPSTDLWCMAWAIGDAEPQLWRPGEPVPEPVDAWVRDGQPLRAWNAQFERTIWNRILAPRYGFPKTTISQWYCTAAEARAMALPGALGDCAAVLGVDEQKDKSGQRLMLQMAKPRRQLPDGRYEWWNTAEKTSALFNYCLQDVKTERAVAAQLRSLGARERLLFEIDQRINDRGVMVDAELAQAAKDVVDQATHTAAARIKQVTQAQASGVTDIRGIITWLAGKGIDTDSLDKASVADLKTQALPADVIEVLTLREEVGKTSVKKIDAMLAAACSDGRIRGTLMFHGASTGRWAGRLIQPQNFPRGSVKTPEQFISAVMSRDVAAIDLQHPPLEVISSLLRSMLTAGPGKQLVAADFSAIEARVIAWFAGEEWRLNVFSTHGQIYEASASQMFNVPWSEFQAYIDRDEKHPLRQKGKVAELALGFQGGWRALQTMGGAELGLSEDEMRDIVTRWRQASPSIVQLWSDLEQAALAAVKEPGTVYSVAGGRVHFKFSKRFLWMQLPSGRRIAYPLAALAERVTPWGATTEGVKCYGVNSVTHKWEPLFLYGGLLCENLVQATAADLLFHAVMACEDAGLPVILTVHDEIVCEVDKGAASHKELEALMSNGPDWAAGLPLAAEGWTGERYKK